VITIPLCAFCKHAQQTEMITTCDAFPDGIPDQILHDGYNHRQPFLGDHGIRFEVLPEFAHVFGEAPAEEHVLAKTA